MSHTRIDLNRPLFVANVQNRRRSGSSRLCSRPRFCSIWIAALQKYTRHKGGVGMRCRIKWTGSCDYYAGPTRDIIWTESYVEALRSSNQRRSCTANCNTVILRSLGICKACHQDFHCSQPVPRSEFPRDHLRTTNQETFSENLDGQHSPKD